MEKEDRRVRKISCDEEVANIDDKMSLDQLQDAVLTILKKYWLHKYFVHLKSPQTQILATVLPPIDPLVKVTVKENIKEITTALKIARGKPILQPDTSHQEMNLDKKWKNLFSPEEKVDGNFMSKKRNVATLHDDGQVSIEPTDPEIMDKMLEKYSETPQSPESKTPSPLIGDLFFIYCT